MQYTHLLYPTYCFVVSLLFVHIFWVWNSKGEFQLRLYFYALSKQGNSEFFNNKLEKYHWENLHYCVLQVHMYSNEYCQTCILYLWIVFSRSYLANCPKQQLVFNDNWFSISWSMCECRLSSLENVSILVLKVTTNLVFSIKTLTIYLKKKLDSFNSMRALGLVRECF